MWGVGGGVKGGCQAGLAESIAGLPVVYPGGAARGEQGQRAAASACKRRLRDGVQQPQPHLKGVCPYTIWYRMQPRDQMSEARPTCGRRGAMRTYA